MDSGLVPGALLDGKYRIHRLLGRGGMGAVYEGENVRIGRRVAIKLLRSTAALDRKIVRRFEREAMAVARIGSHHVTDVLDVGELPSGDRYMVMELLQGQTLADRVVEVGSIAPTTMVGIAVQLLDGLAMMHDAGIIHRDLKPGNIFLAAAESGDFVKILDFGICKFRAATDPQWTTAGSTVLGTPGYLAPEQLTNEEAGPEADLYAVGIVIYRCVGGRLPYNAGTKAELLIQIRNGDRIPIQEVVPDLDAEFAAIVMKAIAQNPEDRFRSAREYRAALLGWAAQAEERESLLADFLDRPRRGHLVPAAAQPPRVTTDIARSGQPTEPPPTEPEGRAAAGEGGRPEDRPSTEPVRLPTPRIGMTAVGDERAPAAAAFLAGAVSRTGRGPEGAERVPRESASGSRRDLAVTSQASTSSTQTKTRLRAIVVGAAVGVAGALVVYEALRP